MAAVKLGSAGRSNFESPSGYVSGVSYTPRALGSAPPSQQKSSLFTSTKAVRDEDSAGASFSSPRSYKQAASRSTSRQLDSAMSSYTTTSTLTAPPRSDSRQKLHKRGGSGSSSHGTTSHFITPFATVEEPFPEVSSTTPINPTPKIKPYLRKISIGKKDDETGIDLSKSMSESSALAGLGIQDFGSRTASDVTFSHAGRRTPHTRNTSGGSQISTGSGSFRPSQPFVHPMRQTPNRPYTPPMTDASSMNDEEAHESSDIVTDDNVQLSQTIRNGRSVSVSSTPQVQAPTPLSQSYTAAGFASVPKLTSTSQTNLSIRSGRSGISSKSRPGLGRIRTDTNRSADFLANSPSSRTSVDKPFSFISRRSDTDPQTRDERIREARRKFEEKEANKDLKMEREAVKRRETESKKQERQRRRSDTSERSRISKSNGKKKGKGGERKSDEPEVTALPRHRGGSSAAAKSALKQEKALPSLPASNKSGWSRFSGWFLGCGKDRP